MGTRHVRKLLILSIRGVTLERVGPTKAEGLNKRRIGVVKDDAHGGNDDENDGQDGNEGKDGYSICNVEGEGWFCDAEIC